MSEAAVREPALTTGPDVSAVGDAFVLKGEGVPEVHCAECDHRYGPATRDPKLSAVMTEGSIADLSDLNAEGMVSRLVARKYFCPGCALLFAVNVQGRDDPVMLEWGLYPAGTAD